MNKIILVFAILLFSTGTYAAKCDNRSIKGNFGFEVSGVNEIPLPSNTKGVRSTHVIGEAQLDGKGNVTINGKGSAAGVEEERYTTSGTYQVDPGTCIVTGNLTWNTQETSKFTIVFNSPSSSGAYQANVLVSSVGPLDKFPSSASGTLTRLTGLFK